MKLPVVFQIIFLPLTLLVMSQPKIYEVKSPDGNVILKVKLTIAARRKSPDL